MAPVDTTSRACRILIIEDDPDDVFLLRRALDGASRNLNRTIEYEHVDNGLDAIYLVSREDLTDRLPDAVILDLNMPRLDGIRFLRSLRQSLLLKNIPVFVLTTASAPAIHEEALRAGADKVYVKPSDAKTLLAIATEIAAATSARNRSQSPPRE
jgi:two-component system chemotaxis response regulator CheY